jgi:hypothetical protein
MASDMRHGNLLLHGWYMSDVSFFTTELPQYALLESFFGVHQETAHIAAAMTYTLSVLLAVAVARGGATGRRAAIRALVVAGIMLAPQLGGVMHGLWQVLELSAPISPGQAVSRCCSRSGTW